MNTFSPFFRIFSTFRFLGFFFSPYLDKFLPLFPFSLSFPPHFLTLTCPFSLFPPSFPPLFQLSRPKPSPLPSPTSPPKTPLKPSNPPETRPLKQEIKSTPQFLKIASLSVIFCFSVVSGNISLRFLPVSFTQAVGATTPFFTAAFAYFMTLKREAWITYSALIPVVLGVVIASGVSWLFRDNRWLFGNGFFFVEFGGFLGVSCEVWSFLGGIWGLVLGCLRAFLELFRGYSGAIRGLFRGCFGPIFGSLLGDFLSLLWGFFGAILLAYWGAVLGAF